METASIRATAAGADDMSAGDTIPTLADHFYAPIAFVENTLAEPDGVERLETEMMRVLWFERSPKADISDLLGEAFQASSAAHAGHHAAEILRNLGATEQAEWFHDVAQCMAGKGIAAFEAIEAFGKPKGMGH